MVAFGWSATDIIKLIEISVVVYQAFNDARKNSSRRFQQLTDEFGRFHTCLELLHNLLEEHNKKLYFGHDQFKVTLEECQEFLLKYASLGDRRLSVVKFIKTIGWTTEEKGTIQRLLTAVHGHAHVIGLYTGYMTLKTSLEEKAVNEKIAQNTQETLNELKQLMKQRSFSRLPFIIEEPERPVTHVVRASSFAEGTGPPKLEQVAKELDGFSHVLKRERDAWFLQHGDNMNTFDPAVMEGDETESIRVDVTLLQTVLQEVEQKLERARNSSKREYNQHVVRQAHRQATNEGSISDMSTSPISRHDSLLQKSPTILSGSTVWMDRSPKRSFENSSPTLEGRQPPFQRQYSASPMCSPLLESLPQIACAGNETSTAATTPMLSSPSWDSDTATRPPSLRLPSAAVDWSPFCEEVQVICAGWQRAWSCKISRRRRTGDCGLSLRAERADGCYLQHDLPALGIAIPHTLHTGANPQAKTTVTFIEPHGHKVRKVTSHENIREKEPKYIFQNATDHKAFQELIYGCELAKSWDILSIESDREKECVTQTLRLWRETHTRIPMILFYANSRKRSAKIYIQEPKHSFSHKVKAEERKSTVQLHFSGSTLDRHHERAGSVSTNASSVKSNQSSRTSADKVPHLRWIVIDFETVEKRDEFLSLWQA